MFSRQPLLIMVPTRFDGKLLPEKQTTALAVAPANIILSRICSGSLAFHRTRLQVERTVCSFDGVRLEGAFVSEEFLCARCARHTRTCCQDSEIHVTQADVRRITPHASGVEFFEFRVLTDPVYDQSEADPFWHQYVHRSDGTRRLLKHKSGGDCIFLGSQGCVLPSEDRPLVCRLYPFDYTVEGLLPKLSSGCPIELLRPGQQLLTELDMKAENAAQLRDQLYQEICE